jgi:VanZ family protein
MRTEARCLCLALAAAVTFQLFYLGAQPFAAGLIPAPWDKLAHLAVFALLTTLLWIGTAGRMPLAVIATAIAVGALDELHQASLPGRFADAADFLADACAATGTGACIFFLHVRNRRCRRSA